MTGKEAIAYIEDYTWSTSKMGLERTFELLSKMKDPQKKLKFIHVTGSNGKGSTCSMVESALRLSGYRTGLYTSPHVCDFYERIKVNNVSISADELAEITEYVAGFADAMEDHPSQFELVTAIAMEYFDRQNCDIVILEVGMGGALDSTNVIPAPLVAAFTNIGLEHTEYLGDTLTKIAATKAGIIKKGCHVVCYDSEKEATDTILKICEEKDVPFLLAKDIAEVISVDLYGQKFRYLGDEYEISLLGHHQIRNAIVAIEILKALGQQGVQVSKEELRRGLKEAKWPARFEVLKRDPLFILDGGHNPQCALALIETLKTVLPGKKVWFLTGVLADKDYEKIADLIAPFALGVVCVPVDNPRALRADDYRKCFETREIPAFATESVSDGIAMIQKKAGAEAVVAFGSLYMAGNIRKLILNGQE